MNQSNELILTDWRCCRWTPFFHQFVPDLRDVSIQQRESSDSQRTPTGNDLWGTDKSPILK